MVALFVGATTAEAATWQATHTERMKDKRGRERERGRKRGWFKRTLRYGHELATHGSCLTCHTESERPPTVDQAATAADDSNNIISVSSSSSNNNRNKKRSTHWSVATWATLKNIKPEITFQPRRLLCECWGWVRDVPGCHLNPQNAAYLGADWWWCWLAAACLVLLPSLLSWQWFVGICAVPSQNLSANQPTNQLASVV